MDRNEILEFWEGTHGESTRCLTNTANDAGAWLSFKRYAESVEALPDLIGEISIAWLKFRIAELEEV